MSRNSCVIRVRHIFKLEKAKEDCFYSARMCACGRSNRLKSWKIKLSPTKKKPREGNSLDRNQGYADIYVFLMGLLFQSRQFDSYLGDFDGEIFCSLPWFASYPLVVERFKRKKQTSFSLNFLLDMFSFLSDFILFWFVSFSPRDHMTVIWRGGTMVAKEGKRRALNTDLACCLPACKSGKREEATFDAMNWNRFRLRFVFVWLTPQSSWVYYFSIAIEETRNFTINRIFQNRQFRSPRQLRIAFLNSIERIKGGKKFQVREKEKSEK